MASDLKAFIEAVEPIDDAQFRVIAIVTDGIRKARREVIASSLNDVKSRLRTTLANIETAEDLKALQPGQELDLSVSVVDPDPDIVARNAFLTAWRELQSALQKVAAGRVAADAKEVTALIAQVDALYKPEFVGLG